MSLSPQVLHVLSLAAVGRDVSYVPLVNGRGSQSRTVGRGVSVDVARRAGWLDSEYKLTDAGRTAYEVEKARIKAIEVRKRRKSLMQHVHWEKGDRCHGLWANDLPGKAPWRYGRVSIGPAGLWDGKSYRWAVDGRSPGIFTHEGEATSLKAAKAAVETIVSGGSA